MSFFKKVLSKVGVGAAKIDTELHNHIVYPGGELRGVIHITGGSVAQQINKIDLDVRCNYFAEETQASNDSHDRDISESVKVERYATLVAHDLPEKFEIQPDETRQIEFCIQVPIHAPITAGRCATWVETNLDIDFALDKTDKDVLTVEPNDLQLACLQAIEELGFACMEAENEAIGGWVAPFIQEFEFKPQNGEFVGKLDEVEVIFKNYADHVDLLLEIDRKTRGFSGLFAQMLGRDETLLQMRIDESNVGEAAELIYQQLVRHS